MKTRILDISGKLALFAAIITFFGSCSRQLTDLSRSGRLQVAQNVAKTDIKIKDQKTAYNQTVNPENKTSVGDVNVNRTGNAPGTQKTLINKKTQIAINRFIAKNKTTVDHIKQKLANSQVTLIKRNTASYKHVSFEASIRTAIICLIIALIFGLFAAVFGGVLGYLFWAVSAVFFVLFAIILLLWLLNQV